MTRKPSHNQPAGTPIHGPVRRTAEPRTGASGAGLGPRCRRGSLGRMTRTEALVVGAIIAALLAANLVGRRRPAPPPPPGPADVCLTHVRQLAEAIQLYQRDHGELPLDQHRGPESRCWQSALKSYLPADGFPAVLVCPADRSRGRQLRGQCEHPTSYRYFAPARGPRPADGTLPDARPILHCPRPHGTHLGTITARLDGCVLFVPAEDAPSDAEMPAKAEASGYAGEAQAPQVSRGAKPRD